MINFLRFFFFKYDFGEVKWNFTFTTYMFNGRFEICMELNTRQTAFEKLKKNIEIKKVYGFVEKLFRR